MAFNDMNNKGILGIQSAMFIIIAFIVVVGIMTISGWDVTGKVVDKIKAIGGDDEMGNVKLETNHGDIVIKLYDDMPITAGNFKKLVEEGYYDGIIFHRIIPDL